MSTDNNLPNITPAGFSETALALDGTSQELIAQDSAWRYLFVQNPTGNGPVKVNLSGGDATLTGVELQGGDLLQIAIGVYGPVTVSGTNGESVIAYAAA